MKRFLQFLCICTITLSSNLFASDSPAEVWVDVRSDAEYKEIHIEGDQHIPHEAAAQKIMGLYPDKDTPINLYCRSGRRAGIVLEALKEAGYTQVENVGGINDAKEKRESCC